LLTCAHTAWKSTSAPLFFRTSGKETVENLKISPGQLALCQEKRIKRQQTVSSARCKVLAPNAGFLLASMPSDCRFRPIECSYSQSVFVFVPQDKIRGLAIPRPGRIGSVASQIGLGITTFDVTNAIGGSVEHCSAIPCHSMLWWDVTLQFVLYFDIVFDKIACT